MILVAHLLMNQGNSDFHRWFCVSIKLLKASDFFGVKDSKFTSEIINTLNQKLQMCELFQNILPVVNYQF